nr:hypothetical protein [Actinomyces sp.]
MELGIVTDSLASLPFEEMLDTAAGAVHATVDLGSLLGVGAVVLMSGLPTEARGPCPSWVTTSWPPETQSILDYQWNDVAIPYWKEVDAYGYERGVRHAVEMHGAQLVYNVHAKDTRVNERVVSVNGHLDTQTVDKAASRACPRPSTSCVTCRWRLLPGGLRRSEPSGRSTPGRPA